jgi:hypothetical protein
MDTLGHPLLIRGAKNSNLGWPKKNQSLIGLPFPKTRIYLRNISLNPKKKQMKKFFAIAFLAAVLVACEEKKTDTTTAPADSTTAPAPAPADSTAAPADSTAAPADSTAAPAPAK